ncbi:MAG: uroporphyrinogen-III C-methyltransferase [Planctomycetes bacterium]|nr:uroporphyrinogen-III C-methyltransferase [Planctomycetota bacterium]
MTDPGTVYLVGAGPGDPGLLTLRGLECLQQADLVLYDGLVNPLLLRHTSAQTERTCRTATADGPVLQQDEINRRLIAAARAGKTVVRLKGGDPFIFGRGSEEAAALAEAEIPFEVVPGITAATAAGVYAGLSLTHREMASSVTFVTGHEDPQKSDPSVDYSLLARLSGTLVFYMGLHRLESIAERLIEKGKPRETPVAVISRATTPAQRVVTASLWEIADRVRAAGLAAPSLIVIGECAKQREAIAWYENRPLFGKRIGILRPAGQADSVIARALALGAQPISLPVIRILPPERFSELDDVLARLETFDWIVFTSVNGVEGLLNRLWETGGDLRRLAGAKLAAIGPATAHALERFHLRVDLIPREYRAESLAESLQPLVDGQHVLWARASRGRDVLPRELSAAGATVSEAIVYQNIDVEAFSTSECAMIERGDIDWIGLSSPSIAENFKRLLTPAALKQIGSRVRLASISPVTTAAAKDAGLTIAAEAVDYTWNGIFDAIIAAETAD